MQLVSLFSDYQGHTVAVLAAGGSNVVALLNSNGTTAASVALPLTGDLPAVVQAAAADFNGNVYLTGQATPPDARVSVVKLNTNLAGAAWTNTCLLTNSTMAAKSSVVRESIADSGNAYCIGRFNQYPGDIDQFVLSIGPNGARWADTFNPAQDNDFDKGISILRTYDGFFFAVGHSDHSTPIGSSVLVRKYTSGGSLLWASNYLSTVSGSFYTVSETAAAAVMDSQGRLLVAGGRTEGFDRGYVVMQISATGQVLWRFLLLNDEDNFAATGVQVDVDDNVLVTGPVGTAKLSKFGDVLWYSPEAGNAIQVTTDQNIVLCRSTRDGNGKLRVDTTELLSNGDVRWRGHFSAATNSDSVFQSMYVDGAGAVCVGLNDSAAGAVVMRYDELPRLTIAPAPASQLTISWPPRNTNVVLCWSTDVAAANWIPVTNAPVLIGNQWRVTVTATNAPVFFKLDLP